MIQGQDYSILLCQVERYQPRSRISRDTTSGESDSNSSEVNGSPLLQAGGTLGQQFAPRRYFATINGTSRFENSIHLWIILFQIFLKYPDGKQLIIYFRSISCVESMPRQSVLQTRRIFEPQQRHSSSSIQRRVPSYLAQKLARFWFHCSVLSKFI